MPLINRDKVCSKKLKMMPMDHGLKVSTAVLSFDIVFCSKTRTCGYQTAESFLRMYGKRQLSPCQAVFQINNEKNGEETKGKKNSQMVKRRSLNGVVKKGPTWGKILRSKRKK